MRTNYDSLAAAVAQVVPVLMIAVYLENRLLPQDRSSRFYQTVGLVLGWFAIVASFAYLVDETPSTSDTTTRGSTALWLAAVGLLAGSLAGTARAALRPTDGGSRTEDVRPRPTTAPDTRPSPGRLFALLVLVLLWRRRR